jgi:Domain of unknown function (DUF4383)
MGMARTVTAVLGAAYLVLGVVGYLVDGPVLGLFEVNELLNLVHVVIGATLAYGATATPTALRISRRVGLILIALGLLGFVAADGFGIMPLGGNDIWLHLSTGATLLANAIFETDDVPAA